MRCLRFASVSAALAVAITASSASAAGVWDASIDFLLPPSHSNTASDVWQYFGDADRNRDGSYVHLPTYTVGLYDPNYSGWESGAGDAAFVFKHTTGGHLALHTGASRAVAIGWRSPINGTVNVAFALVDLDTGGGDGVDYFVDLHQVSSNTLLGLTSGSIVNNGVSDGSVGHYPVSVGDMIYLYVDLGNDHLHDSTQAEMTITQISVVPSPATLGGVLLGGLTLLRPRHR